MGHDIIINDVPISEDALRELLEMLEHQNTSDGDEPGACIRSENFEWSINDDGDIVVNKVWRSYRWINVSSGDTDEMPTEEEDNARRKLIDDMLSSWAEKDRRISWAHFVLHNPRATAEQRREAQEIMDSIPDDDDEEDIADDHIN